MIAVCNKKGAFLYECSKEEADRRLGKSVKKQIKGETKKSSLSGYLDCDEYGNPKMTSGMSGWLFTSPKLIERIILLKCEAVYLEMEDYSMKRILPHKFNEFNELYKEMLQRQEERKKQ